MNHELAEQLKDAGFPQEYTQKYDSEQWSTPKGDLLIPTLSELIEACGDDFNNLIRGWQGDSWTAVGPRKDDYTFAEEGSTAEEAVARLWLSLHGSLKAD
jgi:hypothetical protein